MNYNEKDLEIIRHLEGEMFDLVMETEIDEKEYKKEFDEMYYFMQAVSISALITYYHQIKRLERKKYQKEIFNFTIKKIPIYKSEYRGIHKDIYDTIASLMKANGNTNELINELIFVYYGIGIEEKQRIKDFFINDTKIVTKHKIIDYTNQICECISDQSIEPKSKMLYCLELGKKNSIIIIYFYYQNNWFDYITDIISNIFMYIRLIINRNKPLKTKEFKNHLDTLCAKSIKIIKIIEL